MSDRHAQDSPPPFPPAGWPEWCVGKSVAMGGYFATVFRDRNTAGKVVKHMHQTRDVCIGHGATVEEAQADCLRKLKDVRT